jgi:hypothetical protein
VTGIEVTWANDGEPAELRAAVGSATDDMATNVTGVAIAPQRKSLVYLI